MPRPHKCRRICATPGVTTFKPAGVPGRGLAEVELRLDELEALRLADLEGLYHDEAARRMDVSRPTFGRLVAEARRKVADALLNSKMLVFNGGHVTMAEKRTFQCDECETTFEVPFGTGRPDECPHCHSVAIHRTSDECRGGRRRCRSGQGGGKSGGSSGGNGGGRCRRGRGDSDHQRPARRDAPTTTQPDNSEKENS